MNLVQLVIVLAVVGVFLYAVEAIIPMDARIKRIIEIVVLVGVVIYVIQAFALLGTHVR